MGPTQVRRPIEIIWADTVCRPLKQQRERKKSGSAGNRTQGLLLKPQCSATKLRDPPTATSLSLPYITLYLDDYC